MKYMGSKRSMLMNGLGDLLIQESIKHDRIVDLFSGAAAVSWFAAYQIKRPILAIDLQSYSAILARAVINRINPIDINIVWPKWIKKIDAKLRNSSAWHKATALDAKKYNTQTWSKKARELCGSVSLTSSPIWAAYGGYYYSPTQALKFDAMLRCLPKREPFRSVYLAAVIMAASKCAASPGHTAQPFRPTRTAGPYLREAWQCDPLDYFRRALIEICPKHAKVRGHAKVADALDVAGKLNQTDLVFVDPPYSGVHYSRFYHVLETIARGKCGPVEGVGRYPSVEERPQSSFSRTTESGNALAVLMQRLASSCCTVLFTFPAGVCSNGLSGRKIEREASKWFDITKKYISSKFSTLGGNNIHRKARKNRKELILLLRPRKTIQSQFNHNKL